MKLLKVTLSASTLHVTDLPWEPTSEGEPESLACFTEMKKWTGLTNTMAGADAPGDQESDRRYDHASLEHRTGDVV